MRHLVEAEWPMLFLKAGVLVDAGQKFVRAPLHPQRTFDGDAHVAEGFVGEDLDVVAFGEVGVEAGDLGDLVVGDFFALVAEALSHLDEVLAGVDELHLAAAFFALAVGDDPEVGGDAGVVEEVVGKCDDGFEPVVLDDLATDLRLTRAGGPGEEG